MRVRLLTALACALLIAGAAAQDAPQVPRVGNPHGDMDLDCRLCHDQDSWDVSSSGGFDHDATGFPLEGLHRFAQCRDCHREPVFGHVGTHCADCHDDIHRGRSGPDCAKCHTPAAWVDQPRMRQEHNATALPLVGAHERVDCDACHSGAATGDYVGTPTACYACHRENYEATDDPNHMTAGFATDCERCHGVFSSTWGSGDFIHMPVLTGAHARISCTECHSGGFAGTPQDCAACHQPDYDGTTNPQHAQAGFPTECALCHNTTAWVPGAYDHDATAFPLTGAHRTLDCLACHSQGFTGTPTDCFACHQADYDGTTDPDHAQSGFPTACAACHSTSAWEPASFDHDNTAFPLTGAHTTADCLSCHASGYTGTPTACVACHQADYDGTNDPNHAAANFPTSCQECHTTSAWEPANWDHDAQYFPIYTGRHRDEWNSCTECHVVATDYGAFECILCHAHDDPVDLAGKHRELGSRYSYVSAACYECHPTGRAED